MGEDYMMTWQKILNYSDSGNLKPDRKIVLDDKTWKEKLTPEQYQIARKKSTESPFTAQNCAIFEKGIYQCVCCQSLLFDAQEKYDSGSGWPSFTSPIKDNA